MTRFSAQVIMRPTSGVSKDYVTNTFHFETDQDTTAGFDDAYLTTEIMNALVTLYDDIRTRLGGLNLTGHRIKFVDIDGPRPQYPKFEYMWEFDGPVPQTVLPSEVAVVSSFEASQVAGVRQSSRRGRVYLGPLAASSLEQSTGRLTDAARTAIATAFDTFAGKQDTAGFNGWTWTVYSPTLDQMAQVVAGHVDNAFDTQRRRGVSSTFRSNWTSPA